MLPRCEVLYAIADTCFLIDWSRWRRRDILFRLFRTVFVPERVLDEIRSENTLLWISELLSRGELALFTETHEILEEARRLIEMTHGMPGLRGVDLPEAVCLVVGRRRGYVVLTENRGALMCVDIFSELSSVVVWRALEVIREAIIRGIISTGNPLDVFREYESETRHYFPRRDLEEVLNELGREA